MPLKFLFPPGFPTSRRNELSMARNQVFNPHARFGYGFRQGFAGFGAHKAACRRAYKTPLAAPGVEAFQGRIITDAISGWFETLIRLRKAALPNCGGYTRLQSYLA